MKHLLIVTIVMTVLFASGCTANEATFDTDPSPDCQYMERLFSDAVFLPEGYVFTLQNIQVEYLGNWTIRITDEGELVQDYQLPITGSTILKLGKPTLEVNVEFIPCGEQLWVQAEATALEIQPVQSSSA